MTDDAAGMPVDPTGRSVIRIVVADDHPLYRDGLRALTARTPDLELVGEASTGHEAVEAVERSRPDVVLMTCGCRG